MMTTLTHVPHARPSGGLGLRLRKLLRRRATWVLADQAVVSIGNFLTLRYLLIYLSQEQFGSYGVLFETMNYLNSLQAALIIYPLTIRGASEGNRQLKQIATASTFFTLLLLPILGGAMVVASWAMSDLRLGVSAVVALLLWQIQETLRRSLMSDLRFAAALPGDAIRYLGQALVTAELGRHGRLDLAVAFMVMAGSSALAMVIQFAQIGVQRVSLAELKSMAASFWKLAKWMLPNNGASLITTLGYWYVLKFAVGDTAAAVFTATAFFFKPANPVQSSMCSLIVPAVARANAEGGRSASTRQALRYLTFGATLLAPYFALLLIAPDWCVSLASRGRPEYQGIGLYIRLYVVNYMVVYTSAVLASWLAGLGQTRFSFFAQVMNVVATLVVGLPLTYHFGVAGLCIGGLASAGANLVGTIWFLRHPSEPQATPPSVAAVPIIPPAGLTLALPPRPKLPPRNTRRRSR